ncbi:MAG: alpha/beta hydrolase [Betaproteobacteria bacterium]|nr:alpha/beta hydrolase [Betaproteobacteria bacterium]
MMKRGYAQTTEGQIHYLTHGRGDPLLLLHATPRSAASFAPLMRLLGRNFECFAADTLGFGNSDPLSPKAKMEDLARSMVHFLDAQGIKHAHVLGFHQGNKIAAALAAGFPVRVSKAVLVGMTHSLVVSRKDRNAAIMNIVSKYMTTYRESPDGAHLLRGWAADYHSLAGIWWNPGIMTGRRITEGALRTQESRMIEMIQCRRSIKEGYAMNFGFDLSATLRRIKAPTQVIECCMSDEAHLGAQGPKMIKLLKRGELVTLKNAGFDATEARAADIAQVVSKFLLKG